MADYEHDAVAQDLELDEQQTDEVAGGAGAPELQLVASPAEQAAALKRLKAAGAPTLPSVSP